MKYFLDVNALVAFGHSEHEFYIRVAEWAAEIARHEIPQFYTSSITELGFVRVVSQVYDTTTIQAQALLLKLKDAERYEFNFIVDDHDVSKLPGWVSGAKQTTDGHLFELATAKGCVLATLDEKIPGAFVIPSFVRKTGGT